MEQNKLKIVLILGSDKWGGGEKHVFDLIDNLRGHFEFVLITKHSKTLKDIFSKFDIEHLQWQMSFSLSNISQHKRQIAWLNSSSANGVHCHLNDASFMLSLYRPFIQTKIISTVHGFSSHLYYLLPHYLISVSNAIHSYLLPMSRKKSCVIYNGVKNEEIIQKSPTKNQAYVFATIHPNKGQEFICNSLKQAECPSKITFVGTGSNNYEDRLRTAMSETSPEISWIPKTGDLQKYFESASFIIIPSFKEALSYVALEALSRGIPVLASSTGGLSEVFEDQKHGLFFKTGDPVDFVKKLEQMSRDHLKYKQYLLENSFLDENPHFKIDEMCKTISKFYLQKLI
ncbi:MAG: glycosyltransferase family 4 protein [Candidatus Cloacimonetes bacterium]|nr:glycosyltransferase family 4 protein [Candidatus Cloacimonadota bacterium]